MSENTTPMRLGPNVQVHLASLPASWCRMNCLADEMQLLSILTQRKAC